MTDARVRSWTPRAWTPPARAISAVRALVFVGLLAPALRLFWLAFQLYRGTGDGLGANPIERLTHRTGKWALYCLLATLAVTPLRRLLGQPWLIKLRRMLGLYAFFYGSLHFGIYFFDRVLVQDEGLALGAVLKDLAKRPYITVGTLAYLLMVPLAVTSTASMIRRLGRRWQTLHRLVYVSAVLAIVHFVWLVKKDLHEPLYFGAVLLALFLLRGVTRLLPRRGATAAGRSAAAPGRTEQAGT